MIHKIVRLFVNSLKVDEKHCLLTRDNLTEPMQIELSQKQKTFFQIFFALLTSIINFKHLPKRDNPRSSCISGNTDSDKYA